MLSGTVTGMEDETDSRKRNFRHRVAKSHLAWRIFLLVGGNRDHTNDVRVRIGDEAPPPGPRTPPSKAGGGMCGGREATLTRSFDQS